MMGATIPDTWLEKLMIPPSVPTLPRGPINEGTDQPTADADDSPPKEILIQISALVAVCA